MRLKKSSGRVRINSREFIMNYRDERAGYILILAASMITAALIFAKSAPDEARLDKVKDKLPAVLFPHKKHVQEIKAECAVCHHDNPEEPASCFSCHKKQKEKEGEAPPAKDTFHKLCLSCHKENKDKNKKPPTKCLDCHKKDSP
jgi:hypothetical protein